jgi:large subunit ribosomal protein L9
MPTSEVILIENIPGLGAEADVVKVKAGYARNFLLPRGKAYEVTPTTLKKINTLKAKRAEREAKELNDAQEIARKINKLKITLTLETGAAGKAFGSITAKDLADKIKSELGGSLEIDRHRIQLEHPIKSTGEFEIAVKLHSDVTANFQLTVKSANEEAAAAKEEPAEEHGYKAKPKARHTK